MVLATGLETDEIESALGEDQSHVCGDHDLSDRNPDRDLPNNPGRKYQPGPTGWRGI